MTLAWSRHGMTLAWRADEFGKPDRALYLGGIYVGSWMFESVRFVARGAPAELREKPWCSWFMSDADGQEVGWFATEQEARDALVDVVLKALFE